MFNLEALNRTILNAANMPNMEEILPAKQKPKPLDPVSDIMAATKGVPIGAFPGQNHDAHIQVKMAYLQDPMNGGSPLMQRIKPVLESNIQEHMVLKYQEQITGVTQMGMQEIGPQKPEVAEAVMAQAAQQVLNANQAMGVAQSPEQQLVALEQKKVELQQQKLQMDAANNTAEAALDVQKLKLEQLKLLQEAAAEGQSAYLKKEKSELDRASKETLKALDLLAKLSVEDQKNLMAEKNLKGKMLEKAADIEKDKDIKAAELLTQISEKKGNDNA
jgi:hypothetical protein